MKMLEVRTMPTVYDFTDSKAVRVHESCFRSFQILGKVKELLGQGTPGSVVLELIELMESKPEDDAAQ